MIIMIFKIVIYVNIHFQKYSFYHFKFKNLSIFDLCYYLIINFTDFWYVKFIAHSPYLTNAVINFISHFHFQYL